MKNLIKQQRAALGAILLCAALTACNMNDLLEVEAPAQVPATLLDQPENAGLLITGTIADFECAFGSYVVNGGILGGELRDATITVNRWPVDRRDILTSDFRYATSSCQDLGIYTPLSTARWSADNTLRHLEAWTDEQVKDRVKLLATAAAYAGYSYVLFAEGFCSCAFDLGPEVTPAQALATAVERFTTAISAATTAADSEILNMARVGRARAYLSLGQKTEAAADAKLVPNNFVKNATTSSVNTRRRNRVADQFGGTGFFVTTAPEYRNLTVDGVRDPRVDVTDAGRFGHDSQTRIWRANKYPALTSPMPLATWREAKLIIAEAEGGQSAVTIINELRARHNLPQFSSSDPAAIAAQVLEERRRELFLESHRLNDTRRFNVPLSPAPGTPYPKGGVYGDNRCMPLPDVERFNNPNIRT